MTALDECGDEALTYLRAGTSVELRGLPGSGRSSILQAVTEQLVGTGWSVVEVRGLAGLADRPLEALAVAGLVGPATNRPRGAIAAAVEAVHRALGSTRSVLVVDDADALDTSSIGVLSAAADGRTVPLLSAVSAARRPSGLSLPALVRPGVRLAVPPLAYEDTQELMQQICGQPIHTSTVAVVHARAGGLPGMVRAITENALRRALPQQRDGVWITPGNVWTSHLAHSVEPFLQGLSATLLDGLTKLAHVGAVEAPVARLLVPEADLEELDDRGLLSFAANVGNVVVSVYPPLLADHLSQERLGARRVRLLHEIAEALPGDGARFAPGPLSVADDGRRLAPHLPDVHGVDPETKVVLDAVLNRLVHDHRNAQIMVRRAEWEQHPDATTAVALAVVLLVRGVEPAELDAVFGTDVPGDDPKGRAVLAMWQATYLAYGRGDLAGATALLEATPVDSWSPLLAATADHLTLFLDRVPASPPAEIDDEPVIADAERLVVAERLVATGRPTAALEVLDRLDGADPDTDERAGVLRGLALVLRGDLDAALAWSGSRYEQGRARFDPSLILGHGYVVALVHLFGGDEQALRAHLGPLLAVGVTPLRHSQYQLGTLVVATRLAALAERPRTARSLADQAASMGLPSGPFPLMAAAQAVHHADLAEGTDADTVADRLWAVTEDLRHRGYVTAAVVAGSRAVTLRPDPGRAAAVAALAGDGDSGLLTLLARHAEALTADPDTQLQVGAELVAAGIVGLGVTLQVTAVRSIEASDPGRAADETRRLLSVAERLGGSYQELVEPLAPRSVLTPREREVAELASSGLTNGEIAQRLVVSVRTVENHLHRAFAKLGVQGRGALRGALQQVR